MLERRALRLVAFAIVVILGITAGIAHQKSLQQGTSDFLTEWTYILTRPFLVSGSYVSDRGRQVQTVFRLNSRLKKDNAEYLKELEQLRQEVNELRESAQKANRLQELLNMAEEVALQTATARILVRPATPWAETCTLDIGSTSGVNIGSAVFTSGGLVGQIFKVEPRSSQVVLLTDRKSSVAAMIQDSRSPGICSGQGGEELLMQYIPLDANISPGDAVISSGDGLVFPKGILIGHIVTVEEEAHSHFKSATVMPAVDYRGVEEVLVVTGGL